MENHDRGVISLFPFGRTLWHDEQVPRKLSDPSLLGCQADAIAIAQIGTDDQVLDVDRLFGEVGTDSLVQSIKLLDAQGVVHLTPPHLIDGSPVPDNELVLGRAASVFARGGEP